MATESSTITESQDQGRGDTITTVLLALGAVVAIGGFGVLFSLWWQSATRDDYEVLRLASREFVGGRPIAAGELAESVLLDQPDAAGARESSSTGSGDDRRRMGATAAEERERREELRRWSSLRDFLVGVGRVVRAGGEEDVQQRRRGLHEAIPFLQSSERMGFPPGRMAQGYRVLGETLYQLGRYDEAVNSLTQAIDQDPSHRRELLPLLAESQLNAMAPLNEDALLTIESHLADPTLMPKQRWAGELIHLKTLIALGMWERVDQAISQELQRNRRLDLDLQTEEAMYRDQLLLLQSIAEVQRAIQQQGRYGGIGLTEPSSRRSLSRPLDDSIKRLEILQRHAAPSLAAQAKLWSARAYLVQGLIEDALTSLTSVRQQRPFGAEALLGGVEELELYARLGRGIEMLQATRYMIRELGDAKGFDGSLITFAEFQRRVIGAIEQLRQQEQFESAIDIARSLPPVFDVVEALVQEGITFRQWATSTMANGTDITGEVARPKAIESRVRFRAAGDAFAQAAAIQFDTPDYVTTQWSAIDAYQQGRHYSQSIRLLKPYLNYERTNRLPRGLVAYGRALLAENQPDSAIEALNTCIVEYPRDPLRYDARLLAARAYAEKDDLDQARSLLQENLQDGELTPQSPAWRDSLLTLGELLYERGYRTHLLAQQTPGAQRVKLLQDNQPILEEAIRRLDEAVERYWPIPRAAAAAYLSARASVMSSQWPRIESQMPEVLDSARRTLRGQVDQKLQVALEGFERLHRHLSEQEDDLRLPEKEKSILRNCLLAEADVLREMDRWDDASTAYRAVELRYMNEPTALEAILGRAACARQLGRRNEAEMLIRQARVVLQRIPMEMNDRFVETTRYDRNGWEQLLGWMNQRMATGGV